MTLVEAHAEAGHVSAAEGWAAAAGLNSSGGAKWPASSNAAAEADSRGWLRTAMMKAYVVVLAFCFAGFLVSRGARNLCDHLCGQGHDVVVSANLQAGDLTGAAGQLDQMLLEGNLTDAALSQLIDGYVHAGQMKVKGRDWRVHTCWQQWF